MSKDYISKTGGLYIVTKIKELLAKKVDSEDGKALSSNDFTNEYKNKLDGIASGATKNVVDSDLSSSSTNPVQNKVVYTELSKKAPLASPTFTGIPIVPTASAGTNSMQAASTAFVAQAIANAIGNITGIKFETVTSLPTTGAAGTIYLLSNGSSESQNSYDEYIWNGTSFEKLGPKSLDLSGYIKTSDMVEVTNAEIDAMFV